MLLRCTKARLNDIHITRKMTALHDGSMEAPRNCNVREKSGHRFLGCLVCVGN